VRLAGVLTGDRQVAEELAAEAAARTLGVANRRQLDDLPAYSRRVLVNLVCGRYRRAAVERRHQHELLEVDRHQSPDPGEGIVIRDQLRTALFALPPRQRTVLVLRLYEDLSEAETAFVMKVPLGTVKSLTSRALNRLRTIVEEDAGAD
jgi:RNA polymerase sigma factor (sigma-70 family)